MPEDLRALYTGAYSRLAAQLYVVTDDIDLAREAATAAFVRAAAGVRRVGRLDDPERWLRAAALRAYRKHSPRWRRHRSEEDPVRTPFLIRLYELPDAERRIVGLVTLMELPLVESADLLGMSYSRAEDHLRSGHERLGEVPYQDVRGARLAIEDAVEPPPYERIVQAAGPQRRRRWLATAAVLALFAAAGTVGSLIDRSDQIRPGTPITQVKFVSKTTGYALVRPCLKARCALRLAVTTDGGRRWRQRIVPSARGVIRNVVLTTCCGNAIALDYTRDKKPMHVVSDDGGHTWERGISQESPLRDEQPTRTLPSGWIPISNLAGHAGLSALDTVHRVARPMTHAPALRAATVIAPYAPGGRIWAFGAGRDEDKLAVSDDDGRTWTIRPGPRLPRNDRITTLFPTGQGGVYVQAHAGATSRPDLWYQGPRPGTWQRLPRFDVDEAAIDGVLPDGELWISDADSHAWQTEEHGQSLQPVTRPDVDGTALRLSFAGVVDGMVYAMPVPTQRQDLVFTSTDGQHWAAHLVALPATAP